MRYNRLICNIINEIGTNPTKVETDIFINEFLMGLSAQEYVAQGLALREKVNHEIQNE
jgi:hypothetical protein